LEPCSKFDIEVSFSEIIEDDSSFENSEGEAGYTDLTNILMATITATGSDFKTEAIYEHLDDDVVLSPRMYGLCISF